MTGLQLHSGAHPIPSWAPIATQHRLAKMLDNRGTRSVTWDIGWCHD
ncbi:MAG: hypothetical protein U0905_05895 [Pirellulales bacterium]